MSVQRKKPAKATKNFVCKRSKKKTFFLNPEEKSFMCELHLERFDGTTTAAKTHETHQQNFSVHNLKVWKQQQKKTLRLDIREGKCKQQKTEQSKKHSQNSEAFLWMDESIKKKRKCKRGYDEKLGENSTLQHFVSTPRKQGKRRIFLFFIFTSSRGWLLRGEKSSRHWSFEERYDSWENMNNESEPKTVFIIKLQHCEKQKLFASQFFVRCTMQRRRSRKNLLLLSSCVFFVVDAEQSLSCKKLMNKMQKQLRQVKN
jgi:hypothetical protein